MSKNSSEREREILKSNKWMKECAWHGPWLCTFQIVILTDNRPAGSHTAYMMMFNDILSLSLWDSIEITFKIERHLKARLGRYLSWCEHRYASHMFIYVEVWLWDQYWTHYLWCVFKPRELPYCLHVARLHEKDKPQQYFFRSVLEPLITVKVVRMEMNFDHLLL